MGAMCITKQERLENYQKNRKIQQQARLRSQALNNSVYAQRVKKYTQLYGRQVTNETKQFIKDNYNFNYYSQTKGAGYPKYGGLTVTYRSSLIDRFQTAHKNRYYTNELKIVSFNEDRKRLNYYWQVKTPTQKIQYDCQADFDEQDKFLKAQFQQRWPEVKVSSYTYHPQVPKVNNNVGPSSNNYYPPPTDWNAHYNAEVARSNEQFRQNMNKQAQQWNNYATQKNNRGW